MGDDITKLLTQINKKYGLRVGAASDVIIDVDGLSTGNLAVDYVTGIGGLPLGRVVELYGPASSGKTTTALQCAARLQDKIIKDGLNEYILYLDFEKAIDRDYCNALGLDVEHPSFLVAQPSYLEQGGEVAYELLATGKIRLLIVDSIASMAPKALLEGEFDQRTSAMNRARLLNGWLLRLIGQVHEHQSCAVFINHLMEAVSMTGRPGLPPQETTPGGKGLKFYASLRLRYQQIAAVPGVGEDLLVAGLSKRSIATRVKVKVTKNKVGAPFREAEVLVRFGTGFDNTWSAIQVLLAHGYLVKRGAWITISHPDLIPTGVTNQFQGENRLIAFADEHPTWREQLIATAVELVETHGATALEVGDLRQDDDTADEPEEV